MKHALVLVMVAALVITLVTGCAASEDALSVQVAAAGPPWGASGDNAVDPRLSEAINDFGFDLIGQLHRDGQNSVVSPLSVHAALSMTAVGARSITAEEMRQVLHLGFESDPVGWSYPYLLGELYEPEDVTLDIANSVWAQQDAPFEQDFLDANRELFGAEIRTLDLQAPGAADEINGWVAEHTHDRITEILDAPDPAAVMELVNAVYFLADWAEPFDETGTLDEPFYPAQGEPFDVPLMNSVGSWDYAEIDDAQVVRLPYDGDGFAAYVFVPVDDITPSALLERLSAKEWKSIRASLTETEGSVALPRFELEWGDGVDLAGPLSEMGMSSAFDYLAADFSGISAELERDPGLEISRVMHKTYLRVNEQGTEAAAATDVEISLGAMAGPAEDFFEFRADRPFVFTVSHEPSGALLFLGIVEDPRG